MAGTFRETPQADDADRSGATPSDSWSPYRSGPRHSSPSPPNSPSSSHPRRLPYGRGAGGRPPHAGLCTAIAAAALVMLSAATMVHAVSGGDGTGYGAWTAIIPDAFQFDRHGAAPPPAHTLPDASLSPAGGQHAAHAASSGGGRGTYGSSLRDGAYAAPHMGGTTTPSRGHTLVPDAHADTGGMAAAPVHRHDRWALGEGLAAGDAYAYLVCGAPADPPACFEATLAVVRRDASAPVEGSVYSPATSPIPWHIRVTIRDLVGYYVRDGPAFRMSDYQASGTYDTDMRTLHKAALFDARPPAPWSFDLRFAGVRYEPRPVQPDHTAMRYAGALEDTVFLLGSKIALEMGPYNDRHPVLEDGEQWPNSVGAAVHVRESVPEYIHDYRYGSVEIRGGDPGSGRAMHRVSYTGDAVPMADLIVADGLPFPLSGSVRDAVLPIHFAADPHVDSRWWFRLVAVSSESARALDRAGEDGPSGGMDAGEGTAHDRSVPGAGAAVPAPASATPKADSDGDSGEARTGGSAREPSPIPQSPPPINIPRISGLLDDPAGLYAYLAELAKEMAAAGGGAAGTGGDQPPDRNGPAAALTVSTDRASYTRGQAVAISGVSAAADAQGAGPFVMISVTGPGGASVASLPAPVDAVGTASGASTYAASIDTAEWSAASVPAGNMTVIAVRGTDTATTVFELLDGNASAAVPPPSDAGGDQPDQTQGSPVPAHDPPPYADAPHNPLTVASTDVAYRHGDAATVSGMATRPMLEPAVLLTFAGPDGAPLASLGAPVDQNGRYSRDVATGDWPVRPAGYGTITVKASRGPDTASATFELLPPAPASSGGLQSIPASAFPAMPGVGIAGMGNGTTDGTVPGASPGQDIGSAGIRSHVRYMIDGNRTVGDLIVHGHHSIVVYLGAASHVQHSADPTLWLRIPRTVMDPPDMDGDGRAFDVRIDGAISTSHAEASDDTHHTLSIPVLRTTGVVDVSGPVAAAEPGIAGTDGGAAPPPPAQPRPPDDPRTVQQIQQCTGAARCLRGTITSVAAADTIMLSGGMSVRLALLSVPAPLEAGGEQARRLVASICPVGTQLAVDEDDLGASATSTTFRNRIVAEAYCNDGTVPIQEVIVASGLGTVDGGQCHTSEFAVRPWAVDVCRTGARVQ